MKKVWFLYLILAITLVLAITACSSPASPATGSPTPTAPGTTASPQGTTPASTSAASPTTDKPKTGGTLRMAEEMAPTSSIGWLAEPTFLAAAWLSPMIEPLLEVDYNNVVHPRLATDYKLAPDLTWMELTLRQGVKFHDGTDFNAEAAKWNLEQQIEGKVSAAADWTSVDVIDDYTIRINLKNYKNTMLNYLASYPGCMISPTAFQKNGGAEGVRWNPVGTGPFKFVSYEKGVSMKYERFDDYWDQGKPYLDAIEMTFIKDPLTRWASFEAGEQDITNGNLNYTESELKEKGYNVIKCYSGIAELVPDSKNPESPFVNVKVRQALDYAIDRETICKAKGFGFRQPVQQMSFPGSPSFIKDLEERAYDPEKAKQLLAEAGYPDGFNTTISTFLSDKDDLEVVQGYLSKVGINAKINYLDLGTYGALRQKGWDGLLMTMTGIDANLNTTINREIAKASPFFASLLRTDEFDALYQKSLKSPEYDPALMQDIVRYIHDTAMVNYLWTGASIGVVNPYVHDTGLYTQQVWSLWHPGDAWLSK